MQIYTIDHLLGLDHGKCKKREDNEYVSQEAC